MKIGDLVRWAGTFAQRRGRADTGIVVGGPHDSRHEDTDTPSSYEVVWFDAGAVFWHAESNLEILSENR